MTNNFSWTFGDQWNTFQSVGTMEYLKVLLATMSDRQEKLLNSRRSRIAKTKTFQLQCQFLMVFIWNSFFLSFSPEISGGPPCPLPGPLVTLYFTSNKSLRSKPNKYKRRKKMLDNKMFHNKNTTKFQLTNTNAQST